MKSLITTAFLFLLFVFTFHSIYAMKEFEKSEIQLLPGFPDSKVSILFNLKNSYKSPMLKNKASASFNPKGNRLTYDSQSFYINGDPVFLHSGEIHYFRTPEDQWKDLIIKAKNGGLNCIATYVYWGIHEPKDNIWNFTGRYDIARFVALCKKHGLYVILRIGPIINGETRNAGLPQWVREQLPGKYNTQLYPSSQWYLDAVNDFYIHLADEVKEFFPSKGGNVIMNQIDNETNCSWVWGRAEWQKDAQVTINKYQEMAKNAGFEGPFCATYWETTHTVRPEGAIPATGAYLLGHWNITTKFPTLSGFKLVNTKYHFDGFKDTLNYPVLAIENQGGGGYNTITPPDFSASYSIADIAGGTNATNYYMYGSGTNPQQYPGQWFDQYFGSSVARPDVTKMSYDLHTPLGEFQQVRESYNYVRRLGLFLESFGGTVEELAFMAPVSNNEIFGQTNQVCMREKGGSGFVFVNAYQLPSKNEQTPIEVSLQMEDTIITFPQKSKLHAIQNAPLTLPIRLDMAGLKFLYATANPLTRLEQKGNTHIIFYANGNDEAEYYLKDISEARVLFSKGAKIYPASDGIIAVVNPSMKDNILVISSVDSSPVIIKTLSENESLKAYKLPGLEEQLLFTDIVPLEVKEGKLRFEYNTLHGSLTALQLYPSPDFGKNGNFNNQWNDFKIRLEQPSVDLHYENAGNGIYNVQFNKKMIPENVKEMYLHTTAPGFCQGVEFTVDGMLVGDNFYRLEGDSIFSPWSFGIKRFIRGNRQQWIIEKQPGENGYRVLNKYAGKALSLLTGKQNELKCISESDSPSQLWDLEDSGNQNFRIKSKLNGLYLSDLSGTIFLEKFSDRKRQIWEINHTDECYSEFRNVKSQNILKGDEKGVESVSDKNLSITASISSYSFVLSLKDFTFKSDPGDFVRPTYYSFCMGKEIQIK